MNWCGAPHYMAHGLIVKIKAKVYFLLVYFLSETVADGKVGKG